MNNHCRGCASARKALGRVAKRLTTAMQKKLVPKKETADGPASGQYWSDIQGRWWPPRRPRY